MIIKINEPFFSLKLKIVASNSLLVMTKNVQWAKFMRSHYKCKHVFFDQFKIDIRFVIVVVKFGYNFKFKKSVK